MTSRPALSPPPTAVAGPAVRLVCAGCGAEVSGERVFAPRCPAARPGDDIDHVLARRLDLSRISLPGHADAEPFIRYRPLFHAYQVARAAGWSDDRYVDLVRSLDDAIARVEGHGFATTPFAPAPGLARLVGPPGGGPGSIWVKDETGDVGGSHKARHLMAILLELRVAESLGLADPAAPLAIASCGNAALAAAVVARAAGRELRVFVPDAADPDVVDRLRALDASVVVCPRIPGTAGDPSVRALDDTLEGGAIAFTCQGDRNGFAIEGGATIAWEVADAAAAAGVDLDRVVVQVGGGALASSVALGFEEAVALGRAKHVPRLDTVQTAGGWPLARAFEQVVADLGVTPGRPIARAVLDGELVAVAGHRSRYMWPWETEPRSVAHGILDDETYDWLAVVRAMLATGGRPVIVDEATLLEANRLGVAATGVPADETGTAGLAGLMRLARDGLVRPDEIVAVIFSGVRRSGSPAEAGWSTDQAAASRE